MNQEQNVNNVSEKIITSESVQEVVPVEFINEVDKKTKTKIKEIFKTGISIFLLIILFVVIVMLLTSGLSGLKEMLPVFLYTIPMLLFVFLVAGFISYNRRNDNTFTEKVIAIQNPLIFTILKGVGINFDKSNPKEFYFYYNLLFGIFLIIAGVISFFNSNNYKVALIPFIFGIITIFWGFIKRK
ncbi:MAG: hypothetical protein WCW54_00600 [Candidatus Paceibacterota bacterium]